MKMYFKHKNKVSFLFKSGLMQSYKEKELDPNNY